MVTINGKSVDNIEKKSVLQYLLESSYDVKRVAVEINCDIIPKAQYETTVFNDGDTVEVVSFVGGG